ncbi:MAG: hypothetical protein WBV94_21810 [Blastocatellia bacterium]
MNILTRIFNYSLLLAQLAHERRDRRRERRQLRLYYERELARAREERDELWRAYNRVIDRIGQKSGMLPIFENRPEPKEQTKEQREMARASPIKRAAMAAEKQGDELAASIKGEVEQFVKERRAELPHAAENSAKGADANA